MTKAKSKRLLSLLLSLALVFTMVAPVCAADNTVTTDTVTTEAATETAEEAVTTIDTVEYTANTVDTDGSGLLTSGTIAAGTYTLTDDVTLTGVLTVASSTEVTIDLNGHTISYSASLSSTTYLITNNGTLTIQDSSTGGTGEIKFTVTGGTSAGYIIYNYGTFTLAGGTLSATASSNILRGIHNAAGATTTVTGGTINLTGGSKAVQGIYTAASKTINFTSGTINVSNSSTSAATGIYIAKVAATVNVNSGSITATNTGSAAAYGIYEESTSSSAATINVQSGTITATSNSGTAAGIYKSACAGKVSVSGGTISATSSSGAAYGVYSYYNTSTVYYADGSLTLSGGTISAKSGSSTATVYGWYAQITLIITGGSLITEGGTAMVATKAIIAGETYDDVLEDSTFTGTLTDGTTVAGGTYSYNVYDMLTITKETVSDISTYYYDLQMNSDETYTVILVTTTDEVASVTDASDSTKVTIYATLQKAIDNAGSGDTVTLLTNVLEDITIAADDNIILDLNGYTLTGTGAIRYAAGETNIIAQVITLAAGTSTTDGEHATLVIKDSSAAGTGTITGGYIAKDSTEGYGAAIYAKKYANVTLESGTITGNNNLKRSGGAIYLSGATFTMTGGVISNNYAYYGGAVATSGNSTVTMTGGTIDGNTAQYTGGGLYIYGSGTTATISGGTISNNGIKTTGSGGGGGIYVGSSATVEISNVAITGNGPSSTGSGAAYYGGGIYVVASGTATFNSGTISGNTAKNGGGVYVAGSSASSYGTFTMTGGAIYDNTATTAGADFAASQYAVVTLLAASDMSADDEDFSISAWYTDASGSRYADGNGTAYTTTLDNTTLDAAIYLAVGEGFTLGISSDTTTKIPAEVVSGKDTDTVYVKVSADYIGTDGYYSTDAYPTTSLTFTGSYTDYANEETVTEVANCGYIFAGWYTLKENEDGTTSYTCCTEDMWSDTTTTEFYAKFVDANVLTVKFQYDTTATATTPLRLISTVDTLDYAETGFYFQKTLTGTEYSFSTTTVYAEIDGANLSYEADYFSSASEWFVTKVIKSVSTSYEPTMAVTAYWVTYDGTTVRGETREFTMAEIMS